MLRNKSIETIGGVEVIDLQATDVSPFMSLATVKVLYIGENRNGSKIDKDTAESMGKTLRGAPIVGFYDVDKRDFRTHEGIEVTYKDGKLVSEYETKPYGFIPTDAKVWFKDFQEGDEVRTYMLTTCYLWTHQYPEAAKVATEGAGQSMELDHGSVRGEWDWDSDNGLGLYIINDATISKLCILGDDVEPCFEGASIVGENFGTSYALEDLTNTVGYMFSLVRNGNASVTPPDANAAVAASSGEGEENGQSGENVGSTFSTAGGDNGDNSNGSGGAGDNGDPDTGAFAAPDDPPAVGDGDNGVNTNHNAVSGNGESQVGAELTISTEEHVELQAAYDELRTQFEQLQESVRPMREELESLRELRRRFDHEERMRVISKYSNLLTEEELAPFKDGIDTYDVETLDAKLSVLYVRNHVTAISAPKPDDMAITFSMSREGFSSDMASGLFNALRDAENNRKGR